MPSSYAWQPEAGEVAFLVRAGSSPQTAVCLVDREEGGTDALARHAVRLRPLFRAGELLAHRK